MNDLIVMAEMPSPNVWRAQHCRSQVVARTLVDCNLAIVLSCRRTQGIGPEVRRVPSEVVTVLVIKDPGIVRSVGAIGSTHRLHQRSILKEIFPWAEVNFSVWRDRLVFGGGFLFPRQQAGPPFSGA